MAEMMGMDAAEVRGLAARLRVQADSVGATIDSIDGIVQQMGHSWQGPAAIEFIGWWQRQHRPRLMEAREQLAGLAQSADNNANQQDITSGASGRLGSAVGIAIVTADVASAGAVGRAVGKYSGSMGSLGQGSRAGSVRVGPTAAVLSGVVIGSYGLSGTVRGKERWGAVRGSGQASGFLGASGAARGSVGISSSGLTASGRAEGEVGAFGKASQTFSADGVTSVSAASAMAGAVGYAAGSAHFGPGGMTEGASAGGFAGVSASGSETMGAGGVSATATGDVYAGIGAHFKESMSMTTSDVTVKIDVGAALGVGAGGSVAWHVDPAQVTREIESHLPF